MRKNRYECIRTDKDETAGVLVFRLTPANRRRRAGGSFDSLTTRGQLRIGAEMRSKIAARFAVLLLGACCACGRTQERDRASRPTPSPLNAVSTDLSLIEELVNTHRYVYCEALSGFSLASPTAARGTPAPSSEDRFTEQFLAASDAAVRAKCAAFTAASIEMKQIAEVAVRTKAVPANAYMFYIIRGASEGADCEGGMEGCRDVVGLFLTPDSCYRAESMVRSALVVATQPCRRWSRDHPLSSIY